MHRSQLQQQRQEQRQQQPQQQQAPQLPSELAAADDTDDVLSNHNAHLGANRQAAQSLMVAPLAWQLVVWGL